MNNRICVIRQGKLLNKIRNKVLNSLCKVDNPPKHAESGALKF